MTIQYFETARIIDSESAGNGMKRVWFEVATDLSVMLKLPLSLSTAQMQAAGDAHLALLKERQAKEAELQEIEAASAALRAELGL
jgi:hypothetical protein